MSAYFKFCVFVVFVLTLIQKGTCLDCYICSSRENEACLKPDKSKIPLKHCDLDTLNETRTLARQLNEKYNNLFEVDIKMHHPKLPTNCLKQVNKVGSADHVIRGCQIAAIDNLDICVKVKEKQDSSLPVTHCSLCDSNGCNSSEIQSISTLLALITTFIIFFRCK